MGFSEPTYIFWTLQLQVVLRLQLIADRTGTSQMHVIYVHGVSERPNTNEFSDRIVLRQKKFLHFVANAVNRHVTTFDAAEWGDLCPHVPFRTKSGQTLSTESELPSTSALVWEDFVTDGQLNAAAFLEAALLRNGALDDDRRIEVDDLIAELDRRSAVVPLPNQGERVADVLDRIAEELPHMGESEAQRLGLASAIIGEIAHAVDMAAAPFGVKLRDVAAQELAARWMDIVWYFGRGRKEVGIRILDRFDQITRQLPDEPIIVLAHSLGGFIAHDAISSTAFRERGLVRRGPWFLCCLGSQLLIYEKLGLMCGPMNLPPELHDRVWFRNIVDRNDPLGFAIDDLAIDTNVLSGLDFLSSHSSYLDSTIVLRAVKTHLSAFLKASQTQ
jgi:hypothetical protein